MRIPSLVLLLAPVALVACSKSEPPAPAVGPSANVEPAVSALAPAASSAPAPAPSDSTPPAPAASTATSTSKAGAKAAANASAAAASGPTCGTKPLPDCPLQAWMKANTAPAIAAMDFDGLATAYDKIATFAPPGYTNWASIAKDGAAAARSASESGVKGGCRGCHEQYKEKYKKELRSRPIS